LTSSTITEFRSRPRNANPDAPEREIYSDREWKLVTYTLLLKRATDEKEEVTHVCRLTSADVDRSASAGYVRGVHLPATANVTPKAVRQ
jgi:hypothetical protein